jgi:hypothetical protein
MMGKASANRLSGAEPAPSLLPCEVINLSGGQLSRRKVSQADIFAVQRPGERIGPVARDFLIERLLWRLPSFVLRPCQECAIGAVHNPVTA